MGRCCVTPEQRSENMHVITINMGRHDLDFIDNYTASKDCPFPSRSEFVRAAVHAFIKSEIDRLAAMKETLAVLPPKVREVKTILKRSECHNASRVKRAWHWETVTDEEGTKWNKKVYLEVQQ